MTTLEERAPLALFLTPTGRAAAPTCSEPRSCSARRPPCCGAVEILAEPVHVDLGLAEQGVLHQQAFRRAAPASAPSWSPPTS